MIDVRKECFSNVDKDGLLKARKRADAICKVRGGKFKLSEKQFIEEMTTQWICGEFSAAERILRAIELDPEVNTKDLIRGEIHIFMLDVYNVLKKRGGFNSNIELEDLIDGKYSTEFALKKIKEKGMSVEIKRDENEEIVCQP